MTTPHPLPAPPALDVPETIALIDVAAPDDDPRFALLQTLHNWIKVYDHHAQALLEELWSEARPNSGDKSRLRTVTGMSRMGVRLRAEPGLAQTINQRRRKTPPDEGTP